jgi:hypothetical protein
MQIFDIMDADWNQISMLGRWEPDILYWMQIFDIEISIFWGDGNQIWMQIFRGSVRNLHSNNHTIHLKKSTPKTHTSRGTLIDRHHHHHHQAIIKPTHTKKY